MKKSALLITMITCTIIAKAQSISYHAFSLDADLGFGSCSPNSPQGAHGAVSFTIEPHYRVTDVVSLGMRFQFAGVGDVGSGSSAGAEVYSCTSIGADYYFNTAKHNGSVLVFAGGGLGAFSEADSQNNSSTNFGIYPRLGLETSRFRTSFEYNVTGGKYNYISLNFGLSFGGGLK